MVRKIMPTLLVLIALSLVGCLEYGDVRQGRVVKNDASQNPAVVWFIMDTWRYTGNHNTDIESVVAFHLPTDRGETGRVPTLENRGVGEMAYLNIDEKYIVLFDLEGFRFTRIPVEVIEHEENVHVRERHPRVWDPTQGRRGAAKVFPIIDENARTIEIFFQRMNTWTKIRVSEEIMEQYNKPEYWRSGDEVRVYYKQAPTGTGAGQKPGRSLRFMNVTHTDINARG